MGKEDDIQECKKCHRILPGTAFTTQSIRADGAYKLKRICRECWTIMQREHREARKNATSNTKKNNSDLNITMKKNSSYKSFKDFQVLLVCPNIQMCEIR